MYTDDNGIVRFESLDNIAPLQVNLNAALESVSDSLTDTNERIDVLEEDTGWLPITITDSANFVEWSNSQPMQVRRIGQVVTIRGAVRCTTANYIIGTTQREFARVPSGYGFEPDGGQENAASVVCQGSGNNRWHLTVTAGGILRAARYGPATTHNNNLWMPFTATWIVG